MGTLNVFLLGIILLIDTPTNYPVKDKINKIYYKAIKSFFIFTGILHGYVGLKDNSEFSSSVVSGVLLFGLAIIYTSASEHTGIEDKIARKTFKKLTWLSLIILSVIHISII